MIEHFNLPIEKVKENVGQIPGLPRNPRRIRNERFEKLKKSIKDLPEMTQASPLLVFPFNDEYVVIGGNMRLKAYQDLGWEKVPCCILPSNMPVDKLREMVIQDNNPFGETDWDAIANEWDVDELKDWGIELPADWNTTSNAEEQKEAEEDDFTDEDAAQADASVKSGEIWQLGEHRLMCGDSTDAASVALLIDGQKADLVFTDPPYGMKKEKDGVLNDNLSFDDLLEFNKKWIPISFDNLKQNGSWYCWGIDEPLMDIYSEILKPMIRQNKITFRNLITWNKNSGQGQRSKDFRMYPIADEKCLFVMMGEWKKEGIEASSWVKPIVGKIKAKASIYGLTAKDINKKIGLNENFNHFTSESVFRFPRIEHWITIFGEESVSEYIKLKEEYEYLKNKRDSERAYFDNTHDNMNNVWHFERARYTDNDSRVNDIHATPKPIALCGRGIKSSSREGESVLDLFGGSGSTLIACEQLKRKCYMMELDPHYCDVIIARWEKLTGKEAVKVDG